jgi:membrane protein insertase Oxa1/YidC/SpoIIIJ
MLLPDDRRLADPDGHHHVHPDALNPTPPDPTQAMIFTWMPVVFTFMLATFPAGLVIYWTWNNTLSILQQGSS